MTLLPGTTVGRYQILEPLGQGGMATVYKAFQPSLQREVALKVLRPGYAQDQEFRERFEREAIAIAKLRHPHIVQVFDFEIAPSGEYVLAMEFLEGGTLKERLTKLVSDGRGIDAAESVRILGEVAEALSYAHEKSIVHRDVKPSNVMLTHKDWAVVTDFGIARILGATSHTQTGVGIGTPEYMAPEQGQGVGIDHRADIYSLGAMAYELLTGRVPYSADTPLAIVLAHIKDPLPLPSKVNPTIGKGVGKALLKALAKDPAQRFDSATSFAEALKAGLAEDMRGGTMPTVVVRAAAASAAAAPRPAARPAPAAPKQLTLSIPPLLTQGKALAGIAGVVVIALVVGAVAVSGALRGSTTATPSTAPGTAGAVATTLGGTFASLRGELIYQSKLDQPPVGGQVSEINVNGAGTGVKIAAGELQVPAPEAGQQTEVVFNAGRLTQFAAEMQVSVAAGSIMRFAFCPRNSVGSNAPSSSYCFTFRVTPNTPTSTLELLYASGSGGPERIGDAVTLALPAAFRLGVVTDRSTFRLWIDEREIMQRSDTRIAEPGTPPLFQVGRLGSNPNDSGTVRIRDVRIYRLAGQSGAGAGQPPPAPGGAAAFVKTSAPGAGQATSRPAHGVPSRGALLYEATLDGVTQVIQAPNQFRGSPADVTLSYFPGAIELKLSGGDASIGGFLATPTRSNYLLECDLSATGDANGVLVIGLRQSPTSTPNISRFYQLVVDLSAETLKATYSDATEQPGPPLFRAPLTGIRSGRALTIAAVLDGPRIAFYVDEKIVGEANDDRIGTTARPPELQFQTTRVPGQGTLRIFSLRMYEVR